MPVAQASLAEDVKQVVQLLQPGLEDEIRSVATLASVTLALLTLFTTRRAEHLKAQKADGQIRALTLRRAPALLPDVALLALTIGALVAMAPLFVDAFAPGELGRRDGALRSMFSLIWAGFLVLAGYQLWLLWSRMKPGLELRRSSTQARKTARSADAGGQ